ncbi:unnamed protein product [marine sediment metagenome]|uniref:Uncharacterized protein n=1 Tax=marine sediment metagenome TaxID=412755 RepID=X1KI45_9ZZZZ
MGLKAILGLSGVSAEGKKDRGGVNKLRIILDRQLGWVYSFIITDGKTEGDVLIFKASFSISLFTPPKDYFKDCFTTTLK